MQKLLLSTAQDFEAWYKRMLEGESFFYLAPPLHYPALAVWTWKRVQGSNTMEHLYVYPYDVAHPYCTNADDLGMTHEEFQEKVKAIPDQELAEMAQKALSKFSTGGQSFTMTVPPRLDDTDIILSEVIKRFEVLSFITA